MDIHKPKPWHGVREFLKEYVIIVVGVLTALGAEAVVQNLHERRLSAEATEAIRDEINVDITSLARRGDEEPCIARRLNEIAALLDAADAGKPFKPVGNTGGPFEPGFVTSRWAAAAAGGRTSLLSSEEQRRFGRVYQPLQRVERRFQEEFQTWETLRALGGLRRLSPGMIDSQRIAVAQARQADASIRNNFNTAKEYAAQLGVKGDAHLVDTNAAPHGPIALAPICGPLTGAPEN